MVPEGANDVLGMALGTPEHRGRVRGVGRVKPSVYFNLPINTRDTVKEIVNKLGEIYETKTQELLRQEGLKWQAKLDALLALIPGTSSPSGNSSAKASCNQECAPAAEQECAPVNEEKVDVVEEVEETVVYKKVSN